MSNSKRILDSLTKFHFVKIELAQERKEKTEWKSSYFTLNNQTVGCKNELIGEKKLVIITKTALDEKTTKYQNANKERWIFRGSTLVGIAFFILKSLK